MDAKGMLSTQLIIVGLLTVFTGIVYECAPPDSALSNALLICLYGFVAIIGAIITLLAVAVAFALILKYVYRRDEVLEEMKEEETK